MRRYLVTTALAAVGLAVAGGQADAQNRRGSPYRYATGYYMPYTGSYNTPYYSPPTVGTWTPGYTQGMYGYQPTYNYVPQYDTGSVYGGYPSTGYAQPVDNTAVIRSLYLQYLGREPDPEGLQYWSGRLAGAGGNIAQITQDFAAAAQNERAGLPQGTNPAVPAVRYYYGFR